MQTVLDDAVWKFLTDALTTPRLLERRVLEQDTQDEHQRLLERKETLLETSGRLDKKRLRFLQTLGEQEDESTRGWLSGQIKELAHQMQGLEQEIRLLDEQQLERDKQLDVVKRLVEWGQRSRANLETMSLEEKRQLLYGLGVKVRLWNSHHAPRATIELGGIKSFPVAALPLHEMGGWAEDAVANKLLCVIGG